MGGETRIFTAIGYDMGRLDSLPMEVQAAIMEAAPGVTQYGLMPDVYELEEALGSAFRAAGFPGPISYGSSFVDEGNGVFIALSLIHLDEMQYSGGIIKQSDMPPLTEGLLKKADEIINKLGIPVTSPPYHATLVSYG